MTGPIYEFADFHLDAGRFELLRNGSTLRLERKPMELLILLAAGQGRVVSRTEIAERLWGADVFVDTEHGINTAVRKLRRTLRDDPEHPRYIQTVTGKGYLFLAGVKQTGEADSAPLIEPEGKSSATGTTETLGSVGNAAASSLVRRRNLLLLIFSAIMIVMAAFVVAVRYGRHQRVLHRSPEEYDASLPTPQVGSKAHEAYTHGWYLWYAGHLDAALPYFRKATELEPDYAPGWIGLSLYYGEGAIVGILDPRSSLQEQEATARKAVQLDDASPEAHLALASAIFCGQWNWAGALAEVDRALVLEPRYAEAYHVRAKIFSVLNRPQETIAAQRKAIELDPSARPWAMAYVLYFNRQYDAAQAEALQRLEANPQDTNTLEVLTSIYQAKRMYKESVETQERWLSLSGDEEGAVRVRRAFRQGGYAAVLRQQIATLTAKSTTAYVSPVALAMLYGQLGEKNKTLELLEEGFRQHSPLLLLIQNEPAFDFLHSEPRYRSLIQRIDLPPAY